MKKHICKTCNSKHWNYLNAMECCDDIKIKESREKWGKTHE